MKGTLYLIPTVIAVETAQKVIPPQVIEIICKTDYFLVENVRTARRFLSDIQKLPGSFTLQKPIEEIEFVELSKTTSSSEAISYLEPVLSGKNAGILSEAGCPGIADPGALAVKYAHQNGIKVVPLVGPSSILLALMASGFSGQSFAFHGYLPISASERINKIKSLEHDSLKRSQTQIFMETPYRNEKLFKDIINTCSTNTLLCVATDITGKEEYIATKTINEWRKRSLNFHKIPAIFLLFHG